MYPYDTFSSDPKCYLLFRRLTNGYGNNYKNNDDDNHDPPFVILPHHPLPGFGRDSVEIYGTLRYLVCFVLQSVDIIAALLDFIDVLLHDMDSIIDLLRFRKLAIGCIPKAELKPNNST